jgi:hypothetical protein
MRILVIGEVGDKTGGDKPREHCNIFLRINKNYTVGQSYDI